jgi:hypothetical protein
VTCAEDSLAVDSETVEGGGVVWVAAGCEELWMMRFSRYSRQTTSEREGEGQLECRKESGSLMASAPFFSRRTFTNTSRLVMMEAAYEERRRTADYVFALKERVVHLGRLGNTVFDSSIGKDLDVVALPQVESFR